MCKKIITIHQSLHGYSRGHRLLKSSISLSQRSRNSVLFMSDLSGPSVKKGFETYYTGYTLLDEEVYAFAKTWYAFEMPRQGSVWTHTLYINLYDIDSDFSFEYLSSLFKKPLIEEDFAQYEKPIELEKKVDISLFHYVNYDFVAQNTKDYIYHLYYLFYNSNNPIIIRAESSQYLEKLVLNFLSNTWTAIKRISSFCTGSLELRALNNKPLDLQIVPYSLQTKYGDIENLEKVNFDPDLYNLINDAWQYKNDFNLFLRKYVTDNIIDRTKFHYFVKLYRMHSDSHTISEIQSILYLMSDLFPGELEATQLKTNIINSDSIFDFNDYNFIYAACTIKNYSTFFNNIIVEKFGHLWNTDRKLAETVLMELLDQDTNALYEQIIKFVAHEITFEHINIIIKKRNDLIYPILQYAPWYAENYELWNDYYDKRYEMLEALSYSKYINDSILKNILYTLIIYRIKIQPEYLIKKLGLGVISIILDILAEVDDKEKYHLKLLWEKSLEANQLEIIRWVNIKTDYTIIDLVIEYINPNNTEISTDLVSKCLLMNTLEPNMATFLLAYSFNSYTRESSNIASMVFEYVHDLLAVNKLSIKNWNKLEVHLPDLGFKNWDKCERLRRGIVLQFLKSNWNKLDLFKMFRNEVLIKKIIKTIKKYDFNNNYLHSLKTLLSNQKPDISSYNIWMYHLGDSNL